MNLNNLFSFQIILHPSDISHSFRLYRASITPEIYELGIALGVVSLLFGGLFTLIIGGSLLTFHRALMANELFHYPIIFIPIFIFAGILGAFDLIPSIRIWLRFHNNKDYYSKAYNVAINNEQISFQKQGVEANYKWDFFKDCVEGKKEFILVYGKMLYIIIPKHVFRDENEIEAFRLFLKRKFSSFKQKNKIWFDFQK